MLDYVPGVFAFAVPAFLCIAVSGLVYRSRPDRLQNRLLGLALFLDGLNWFTVAVRVGAATPDIAVAVWTTQFPFFMMAAAAYLAFIGTLDTPLVRPLSGHMARRAILIACVLALAAYFLVPRAFISGQVVPAPAPWRWVWTWVGKGIVSLLVVQSLVLLFALLAAIHAWRRQPVGTLRRSGAAAYALAFGARDLVLLVAWLVQIFLHRLGSKVPDTWWGPVEMVLVPLSIIAFCGLVSYGILRHQLFDIDLKIKWTIKKGTLIAAFVALFFIVSESAALFLGDRWGPYLGILAAGLLLFAIVPLQRLAERVADRAMPDVADTLEYVARRKEEVYRATLEEILTDGAVTAKERRILFRLQDRLGLSAATAQELERTLVGRRDPSPEVVRP